MSTLQLIKKNLASRAIRSKITGGSITRKMKLSHEISRQGSNSFLGNIQKAWDGFTSGLMKVIGGLGWGGNALAGAWAWLSSKAVQVWTFDWNQSDKQLETLMESQNVRIAAAWGSALGRSAGWLAGIAVGYGLSFLCPVIGGSMLAKTVGSKVGAEALGEISQGFLGAVTQTLGAWADNTAISAYINYRKLVKSLPESVLGSIYGSSKAKFLKESWGKEGGPNLSFAYKKEEFIEGIENKNLRAFVDSFLEEAWDGFTESGFIVAQELDSAYTQAKQAQETAKGKKRTVKLIPDKRKKTETLTLSAGETDLQESVLETLNNYRLISNRDVGQIVGMPADDFMSAKPLRRQLTIVFKTKKEPPWVMPDGKKAKEYVVTVPDADLGLTWNKIKLAAKAYSWGKFRATAHLDNGRQMAVYGSSKGEAEKSLRRMAELSTAKILALNVTEEVEKKNLSLKKEPKTVYPAYATLLVRRPTTGEDGRNFTDNTKLSEDRIRIDLWPTEKPAGLQPLK